VADKSLKNKTINGMAWSAVDKFAGAGISFIIGIVLVRILMPADYGLVGMLAIFFAISELFVAGGFSSALIQKKDRNEIDFSTIFYFNLVVGVIFYSILFFTAPLIANFYNTPQLTVLTRVLSFNIIINALSLVPDTRLTIDLNFKTQAIISLLSIILSGFLGIFAAYHGFGVWALVIQSSTRALVRTFLLFWLNRWIPILSFSWSSFRMLFKFSSNLLMAGFAGTIVNNMYSLLIGKIFAARDLGYYTSAKQFPDFFATSITSVLQGVTFPILASLQDERERMVSVYGRLMRVVVFFVIPSLSLLAIVTGPFIRFFLTEKWLSIIPLMQWLCFARMITPISALNMNILNAIGRSDLYFKVDISKMPITIIIIIISIPLGLKAVVIGHFVMSILAYFINAYYPGKMFGFGALKQIKEMGPVVYATLIMSVCVIGIMMLLPTDFLRLLICIPMGVAIYLYAAYLLRIKEIDEVLKMAHAISLKIRN
jgi:teichuronic acid exporter